MTATSVHVRLESAFTLTDPGVHVPAESAFTFARNERSRSTGACTEVARVCDALDALTKASGFRANWRAGLHVHLGWGEPDGDIDAEKTRQLIRLVQHFEPALATLVAPSRIAQFDGEHYDLAKPNRFCAPLSKAFRAEVVGTRVDIDTLQAHSRDHDQRYVTLNLPPLWEQGSVEVRLHGGTTDAAKVLTWVSLWQQILWSAVDADEAPASPNRQSILPDGDIVALARRYLPSPLRPQQQRLHALLDRRREEVAQLWAERRELRPWLVHAAAWRQLR
jgi:hypothetical protein